MAEWFSGSSAFPQWQSPGERHTTPSFPPPRPPPMHAHAPTSPRAFPNARCSAAPPDAAA
ncbi:hypothetical protein P7K49_004087, partial [Saguinus oedipus]